MLRPYGVSCDVLMDGLTLDLAYVILFYMHVNSNFMAAQARRFGTPETLSIVQEIDADEMALVRTSTKKNRTHDITFFILDDVNVVVIKKPFFPEGAYRAPSGGLHPGERFETGVQREALEETGLTIQLDRYVLRVEATFTCGETIQPWFTHVFSAHPVGGSLGALDTQEIAEVRWSTLDELQGPIRSTLLQTQKGLFAYRVTLTDKTVALLRMSTAQKNPH